MSHYFRKNLGQPARLLAGFTLIELLVSIAILTVILTVVVTSQSTYTEGAALSNLADEIASTMSQAQAYGIGVREFSPGSNEFSAAYGLAFSLLNSGSNSAYIYFADRNGNKRYNNNWSCPTGAASECLGKVNITRGNFIESLCVVRTADSDLCDVGRVDISFARPNTEAQIIFFDNGGVRFTPENMKGARIILESSGGLVRSVVVFATGQVSVQ
ncbi:MAG: prepilin-type N-terminal cleavage/methylation domain-containing protein [Parcubacteria group bacterium]